MDQQMFAPHFEVVKHQARSAWDQLTDEDFERAQGSVSTLYSVIRERFDVDDDHIHATLARHPAPAVDAHPVGDAAIQAATLESRAARWGRTVARARLIWPGLTDPQINEADRSSDRLRALLRARFAVEDPQIEARLDLLDAGEDTSAEGPGAAGAWELVKARAKRAWLSLDDRDFARADGSTEHLRDGIVSRFGGDPEEVMARLDGRADGPPPTSAGAVAAAQGFERVWELASRQWIQLTREDFDAADASVDRLFQVIQRRIGGTEAELRARLDELVVQPTPEGTHMGPVLRGYGLPDSSSRP
jgi:hypothetical protein